MRTFLRGKAKLLFLAFAVAIFAVAGTAMAITTDGSGTTSLSPTIQSDKADYAPGELVTLTGKDGALTASTVNTTTTAARPQARAQPTVTPP